MSRKITGNLHVGSMKAELGKLHRIILVAFLSLFYFTGRAQSNLAFYNSNDQFNAPSMNPAFLVKQQKFTFGIFPLSGMSVGYNNQEMVKGMLLDFLKGDLTQDRMTEIFQSLLAMDVFSQKFESPLLSFGYNSSLGAFNFRINEVEYIRSGLKNNFTSFIEDPAFLTIQLDQPDHLYADGVHYREYSLGYAKEIVENKLTLGIRAKMYFGKASINSAAPGFVTVRNGRYFLETSEFINTSTPVEFVLNEDSIITGANAVDDFTISNYLFNRKNSGFGVDLGINYKANDKMSLSLSVVDLGKINWKSYLNRLNLVGEYEILPQYVAETGDNYLTKDPSFSTDTHEEMNQLFKCVIDSSGYKTNMPLNIFAGAQYIFGPKLVIGLVDRFVQSKGMSQNSFSLTANYEVNKKFSIVSGYSSIGKSYFNLPFAFIWNLKSGQAFLGTDNLFAFVLPSNADYAGISFGTSIYLFQPKEKYKQSEYLPFYKEKKRSFSRR